MLMSTTLYSFLDNDFYKFTMQNGVIKLFPEAKAKYKFINRGRHVFPKGFAEELKKAIRNLGSVKLTLDEKRYLEATCPYLDPTYLDFLQGYCYNPDEISVMQTGSDLEVNIEGYWYRTILWEVPIMALISELFYITTGQHRISEQAIKENTIQKIEQYKSLGVKIADFGTRRRHSYAVQALVVATLKQAAGDNFVGSSNVHLAMINNSKPIGTHAHEWFMFHAAKYGYKMANSVGLENWANVYRGDLGIALSDTFTTDYFFRQFDKKLSKLFDGVRHDSGDPLLFAQKTIHHYKSLGIDPLSKTIIFSDSLNYDKIARITDFCRDKIGISFGIGTNLTNDVGLNPMNMVIKMTDTLADNHEWTPVIKLSDEIGKHTGTSEEIEIAKRILRIDQ
ncbi:MAG: nicotinate phosphoribosyltransferase [Daejeonella sp.]|nr:nicotinate phosphoribosyltransferase [Daejeonella sp.]